MGRDFVRGASYEFVLLLYWILRCGNSLGFKIVMVLRTTFEPW
jgi:hypothetical protein